MYNDLSGTITNIVIVFILAVIIISLGFFLWRKGRMLFTGGYIILYGIVIPLLWISGMIDMYQNGNSTGAGGIIEIFSAIGGVILLIPIAFLESIVKLISNKKNNKI